MLQGNETDMEVTQQGNRYQVHSQVYTTLPLLQKPQSVAENRGKCTLGLDFFPHLISKVMFASAQCITCRHESDLYTGLHSACRHDMIY